MKTRSKRSFLLFVAIFICFSLSACETYKTQVVPFKMPSAFPNMVNISGADIAARAFENKEEAEQAFGFDIIGSGILPVQIIIDNKGPHKLSIVSTQTFLVDIEDNMWPVLDSNLAYERIHSKTKYSPMVSEGAKGAVIAGIAGSAIGAAIGIVTGQNVLSSAGKGAAVGAAAGLAIGGAKGLTDEEIKNTIRKDIQERNLKNKPINQGEFAHGFIFFPGESKKPKEVRLQIKEEETGNIRQVVFRL